MCQLRSGDAPAKIIDLVKIQYNNGKFCNNFEKCKMLGCAGREVQNALLAAVVLQRKIVAR